MALDTNDIFPIYRGSDGTNRKATIGALLAQVGTVPVELSDLTDVDTFGVTDGQMLVWNDGDSEWKPVDVPEGVDLSGYLQKPGADGDYIISVSGGIVSYSSEVDGGQYAT